MRSLASPAPVGAGWRCVQVSNGRHHVVVSCQAGCISTLHIGQDSSELSTFVAKVVRMMWLLIILRLGSPCSEVNEVQQLVAPLEINQR